MTPAASATTGARSHARTFLSLAQQGENRGHGPYPHLGYPMSGQQIRNPVKSAAHAGVSCPGCSALCRSSPTAASAWRTGGVPATDVRPGAGGQALSNTRGFCSGTKCAPRAHLRPTAASASWRTSRPRRPQLLPPRNPWQRAPVVPERGLRHLTAAAAEPDSLLPARSHRRDRTRTQRRRCRV